MVRRVAGAPSAGYRGRMRAFYCLGLVLIASCGSDNPSLLEPEEIAGTYELVSVDGEPLPVSGTDALYDYELLSASIEIGLDDMVHESRTRSERLGLYPAEIRTYTSSHPYTIGAGRIVIHYVDSDATARIRGDEISIVRGFGSLPRSTWVYVRER